ncbi:hypothetical protein F5Y00DRAFT_23882 [Daldinia vernicosa]|uniref:uncharacterized protein n=1 Tax=Daldinia vernicosa TaxID=114800 RepID=UPI00200819FC|nr:uncharacterized protein F5Y00DRAFT_23882 [Daldinia vernicosa]KAI0850990.1 hypothetical protein F5Y00DRAFT_23882 [Daldinia vernicosa]
MHHTRRKSGHAATNNSTTEARRAVTASDAKPRRPQTLTRKSTPQTVLKLGKSPKDREKELEEERWFDDERETFPQFWVRSGSLFLSFCATLMPLQAIYVGCVTTRSSHAGDQRWGCLVMTCEKQFTPQDEKILYCSEACRERDQDTSVRVSSSRNSSRGHEGFGAGLPYYSVGNSEPRDIIPRASPSRWSPPTTPTTGQHSNAISVLRSLSILPVTPTSPLTGNISGNAGLPFTRSAVTSPSTSYTKSANHFYSSTYDNGYAVTGYGYPQGGMTDRPLPSRKPGAYSRPKSIELVTPIVGR